jgi:hypothetical protein
VPIGACAGSVPNATVPLETGRPAAGMNSTCDGCPRTDAHGVLMRSSRVLTHEALMRGSH